MTHQLRTPLALPTLLLVAACLGLPETQASDRKHLRKFKGLYSGSWANQNGLMPLRMTMPRSSKGAGRGTFEATPCDPQDSLGILNIRVRKSKVSRNGKKVVRTGTAIWKRSLVPQLGGPNETGRFRLVSKLRGRRATSKGILSIGSTRGRVVIRQRGRVPTVAAPWMEMVTVGNKNNPSDLLDGDLDLQGVQQFGAVPYDFKIAKYEVTNAQYIEFLNSVAQMDPKGLFNAEMETEHRAGIVRNGISGEYSYVLKRSNLRDKPVLYVSFYDACRFCNWLHNGKPIGPQGPDTTENGAYDLTDPDSVANNSVVRSSQAQYFIPSEDEWYKAAFHQPFSYGGDTDNYWLYPTKNNSVPTIATADSSGNINNQDGNIANYSQGAVWFVGGGNVTTVGSGGIGSRSFYGTFDMAGNVLEWNEGKRSSISLDRSVRGGDWFGPALWLESRRPRYIATSEESRTIGFRIAAKRK